MPDNLSLLEASTLQQQSLALLHAHLTGPVLRGVPCGDLQLRAYRKRTPIAGWRLGMQFSDAVRYIDAIVDSRFPYSPPRIILVDPPPFLTWPHIEEDGALCLLGSHATIDPNDPVAVVNHELKEAFATIQDSVDGKNEDDFRKELWSYWDHAKSGNAPKVISLLTASASSRLVQVWHGKSFYLLAEGQPEAAAWLRNLFPAFTPQEETTETALLLALDAAPLPSEYPKSAKDVLALVRKAGPSAAASLDKIVAGYPERIVVAFVADTGNGPCFCAVTLHKPQTANAPFGPRAPLLKGFRKHTIPPALLTNRYVTGPAVRSSVQRADHAWVHARGEQSADLDKLRQSHVFFAGLGSIGAPIALLLAQAGVVRMTFADQDALTWANLGRHPLGARDVDNNKALALKDHLRARLPHTSIDAYPTRWEDALAANPHLFDDVALVVSATGDWGAEVALNQWHLDTGRGFPIVYVWTEAHACAGHAVAISKSGPCFACGFTATGQPDFTVTRWNKIPMRQEPACGATYQPYGAVRLADIITRGADLAMDSLLGKVTRPLHRIWAGPRRALLKAGGDWSPEWKQFAKDRLEGGFECDRLWIAASQCAACRVATAA